MSVVFKDYSKDVTKRIKELGVGWLEEATGEVESQTKRNTKVDTGKTKGSWTHLINVSKMEGEVGSRYKNALWEEFGTGIYALNGDGRKDVPWVYRGADGKMYATVGKKPRRAFYNAYMSLRSKIIASARERFKGL